MRRLHLVGPAKPVGYYRLGWTARMYLANKPFWLHRWFCYILLGWVWVDTNGYSELPTRK
jgi:hypothetical protein